MNESVNSIQSLYATKQYAVLVAAVLMMLAQAAGCVGEDSGSDAGYDGGGGLDGGSVDASASGSIGGDSCNYPSCLANLVTTCVPSGTCVEQTGGAAFATNDCYSNGVKMISSTDANTLITSITFKNGSTTCYSVDVTESWPTTMTFKNVSGGTIATMTVDTTTNAATVRCAGGQTVALNANCDSASYGGGSSSSPSCTPGLCMP
jgi:hypothetical protein